MMEASTDRTTIADLEVSERPRERLAGFGAQALSSAELVAILLRSGVRGASALQLAQALLTSVGGLSGLNRVDYDQLRSLRGVGPAKAAQVIAALELGRRAAASGMQDRPRIQSPEDAAGLVMHEMSALEQEHLRVALLDTRNHLIRLVELYKGSLNTSVVRVGEVFRDAVRANAAGVIVLHNHPSGDPTPSPEDVVVTRSIAQAGRLLDIEVIDHIIIGGNRFVSLKARNLGFD